MTHVRTPAERFPDLFEVVQSQRVFDDSKCFVDAEPLREDEEINSAFERSRSKPDFDVRDFVFEYFALPTQLDPAKPKTSPAPIEKMIEACWKSLRRDADSESDRSSLIPLPHDYIVPGGRFREIYYWDSYFTMLGLAESGHTDLIRNMADNFAWLIDEIGFIPNGNRSYYCSRSQPPVFALMVDLLEACSEDDRIALQYQPQLLREHAFWMQGAAAVGTGPDAERRVVGTPDGPLNRYWDDAAGPREESYAEDLALASRSDQEPDDLYRNLRAACESGWDFSSRWLGDGEALETIRTTDILPVDLNTLMVVLELRIARNFEAQSRSDEARAFRERAERRGRTIRTKFFDETSGAFVDLDRHALRPTGRLSLATAFPMAFGICTQEQALRVSETLEREFLRPGGWVTTATESGQQWDAPNGWAPLQWIVFLGLSRYAIDKQARDGANRWLENVLSVYESTGRMMEKYDVESPGRPAAGGEYDVQEGFGWSNGVYLKLRRQLGRKDEDESQGVSRSPG